MHVVFHPRAFILRTALINFDSCLLNVRFDADFAAKGLVLDRWCGVLVKLDGGWCLRPSSFISCLSLAVHAPYALADARSLHLNATAMRRVVRAYAGTTRLTKAHIAAMYPLPLTDFQGDKTE